MSEGKENKLSLDHEPIKQLFIALDGAGISKISNKSDVDAARKSLLEWLAKQKIFAGLSKSIWRRFWDRFFEVMY